MWHDISLVLSLQDALFAFAEFAVFHAINKWFLSFKGYSILESLGLSACFPGSHDYLQPEQFTDLSHTSIESALFLYLNLVFNEDVQDFTKDSSFMIGACH